jgi:hypothetical protein
VDSEFCIWNFSPHHLCVIASLPFTCCCHFQLSDSVSLNVPPSKMARTAETVIENTVQETESTVNLSIPLLSLQFADALTNSEGTLDIVISLGEWRPSTHSSSSSYWAKWHLPFFASIQGWFLAWQSYH